MRWSGDFVGPAEVEVPLERNEPKSDDATWTPEEIEKLRAAAERLRRIDGW